MIMYRPITADKDIRLVTLKAGTRDDEVCCTLRHISLTAKPDYEALSYVWGDELSKRTISVGGIMVKPTKNLFDALQHLRYVTQDRYLWVDAICINQKDDDEKAKQVLLMGEIYQRTARLLIWLGLADMENDSDSAMEFADKVGAGLKVESAYRLEGQNIVEVPAEDASDHELAPWKAFMTLCHRPWFTRGWIVQEVSLPESEKVYICGDKSVTWGRLSTLHIAIGLHDWGQKLLLRLPEIWQSGDQGAFLDRNPYQMVYPITSPPQFRKRSASIRDLVHEFRDQSLKDPRDKIYAFLSMATDLKPNDIKIRYGDTTVAEVYTAFAEFLLTREYPGELPLKLLSLCYRSIQELDATKNNMKQDLLAMPSWVPDWTIGKDRRPRLLLEDIRNKDETNCSFKAMLNKPMPKPAKVLDDGKTLVFLGFELGAVEEVGIDVHAKAYAPGVNKENTWERVWVLREQHLSWEQMVGRQIPNVYSTGEDRDEAYWKTLIANRNRSLKLPELGMREAFEAWQQISRLGKHVDTVQSLTDRADSWDKASPFFLAITNATWQRLLFVTKNKQMGLTARGVRKADVVCLLYGTNVPFVLRKDDGGRYTIVGEAYIHGLMDGEGISGLKDEDRVNFHII